MTYKELFEKGKNMLPGEEASIEAAILLESILDTNRNDLFLNPDREVSLEDEKIFLSYLERRLTGEPVQYITGIAPFYGLELYTDKEVLIPRFDTEVLVEEILKVIKPDNSILDLCTGSGCILAGVLSNSNNVKATGIDISDRALNLAKRNLEKYNLKAEIFKSDLFENVEGKYDIIVSNPPYIESEVIEGLEKQVKEFEPRLALDGGEDGLIFYRIIVDEAKRFLNINGKLMFEIGYNQGKAVKRLLLDKGYDQVKIIKDLCGNDRVVTACHGGNNV